MVTKNSSPFLSIRLYENKQEFISYDAQIAKRLLQWGCQAMENQLQLAFCS